MADFDLESARKEGYSDSDIAEYLAKEKRFDLSSARKEGYSDTDILNHLTGTKTAPVRARATQALPRSLAFGTQFKAAEGDLGSLDDIEKGAVEAGGRVTDLTGSPLAGTAVRMIPDIAETSIGGITGAAPKAMKALGENLMVKALGPLQKDLQSGKALRAAKTMLEEDVNVTKGGIDTLKAKGEALNQKVTDLIASRTGTMVDKNAVASRIQDVITRVEKSQATPQDATAAAERVYDQFLANGIVPKNIPVKQAQELKQGIYKMLKDKYGELGSETVESQKSIARGLKEEMEKVIPEIAQPNSEAAKLWNAVNVAERKVLLESKKHIAGIAGLNIQHPGAFMAMMVDRSAAFKGLMARMAHKGANIPAGAGAIAGATTGAVSDEMQE